MRKTLLPVLVVAAGTGLAHAAGAVTVGPDDLIAARQADMKLHNALVGAIKHAIDNKVADVRPYKDAGDALATSAMALPGLFPEGTERGHDTRALPAIWSDQAGFRKAAATLAGAAQTLSRTAAAGDGPGFVSAFQAVGQACVVCHRTYRAR
jgi:cytochrome c556